MKKFSQLHKSRMIRPIVRKLFARLITGAVLALLWDRFVNVGKLFSIYEYAFVFLGIFLFAMAWLSYLKLDGVDFLKLTPNKIRKKPAKHQLKQMIDFAGEEVLAQDFLDEKDEALASLWANLLAGVCFILPPVLFALF